MSLIRNMLSHNATAHEGDWESLNSWGPSSINTAPVDPADDSLDENNGGPSGIPRPGLESMAPCHAQYALIVTIPPCLCSAMRLGDACVCYDHKSGLQSWTWL